MFRVSAGIYNMYHNKQCMYIWVKAVVIAGVCCRYTCIYSIGKTLKCISLEINILDCHFLKKKLNSVYQSSLYIWGQQVYVLHFVLPVVNSALHAHFMWLAQCTLIFSTVMLSGGSGFVINAKCLSSCKICSEFRRNSSFFGCWLIYLWSRYDVSIRKCCWCLKTYLLVFRKHLRGRIHGFGSRDYCVFAVLYSVEASTLYTRVFLWW